MTGQGTQLINSADGKSIYKGTWKNGFKHGLHCEESWNSGASKYTGEYYEGVRTGKGKYQHNGNSYEGDFEKGLYHGQGKYYFADSGRVYQGQFVENHAAGNGVMVWPDGSRYEGSFKNGKMHGSGT